MNGEFQLQVLNYFENFNLKTNSFDNRPHWEHPFLIYTTKSRTALVDKLEELMQTLPAYQDPRILIKRGIIDAPYRVLSFGIKRT